MRRPEPDSPDARRRAEAAAEWLVRRDRDLTAAEQDEFLQWLAYDPRHGEWLALHRHTVADFSALARWQPELSAEPNPDLLAPARPRIRRPVPFLLAAAAAVAVAAAWWWAPPAPAAGPVVAERELSRRLLADGSAVELNRGAVVDVALGSGERRATLLSGEAHFTVAKDPARPFVVRAGNVAVQAVGTAFSVRLDDGVVEVIVTEGRVGVRSEAGPDAAFTLVEAGQRALVPPRDAGAPRLVDATPAEVTRHLAWQPRLLDFSSAPLAVALGEFNRRNQVQFELAEAELGAIPIVASIRSDNVEGFAQFLAAAPGVRIERRGPGTIVVHRQR